MNIYKYSRYIYISIKKYNKRKVKSSKICSFLLPTRNFEINHKLEKRSTTERSHWHSWHRQMQSSSNHDVWVVERRNRFVFQRAINLLGEAIHEGTTLFFRWYSLFLGGGRRWNICSRNGAYPVTHERFKSAAKTLHRLCPVQLFN